MIQLKSDGAGGLCYDGALQQLCECVQEAGSCIHCWTKTKSGKKITIADVVLNTTDYADELSGFSGYDGDYIFGIDSQTLTGACTWNYSEAVTNSEGDFLAQAQVQFLSSNGVGFPSGQPAGMYLFLLLSYTRDNGFPDGADPSAQFYKQLSSTPLTIVDCAGSLPSVLTFGSQVAPPPNKYFDASGATVTVDELPP